MDVTPLGSPRRPLFSGGYRTRIFLRLYKVKLVKVNPPRKHLHVLRLGALFGDIEQRGNSSRYLIRRLLNGVFRQVRVSRGHTLLLVSQQLRHDRFRKADRRRHRRERVPQAVNFLLRKLRL